MKDLGNDDCCVANKNKQRSGDLKVEQALSDLSDITGLIFSKQPDEERAMTPNRRKMIKHKADIFIRANNPVSSFFCPALFFRATYLRHNCGKGVRRQFCR
jgi:hypothetical protein